MIMLQGLPSDPFEEGVVTLACPRFVAALAPTLRVLLQPLVEKPVQLTKGLLRIPESEVRFPARCLPVDLLHDLRQRTEAALGRGQFSDPFSFDCQRLLAWLQVEVAMSSPVQVVLVAEGE